MRSATQSSKSLPPGAPVYYLGRHADWWITAFRPQPRPVRFSDGAAGPS
jgi:hypothetical protein